MDRYLAEQINKRSEKVAQKLRKVGVHNYYVSIMARWNNTNWVYDLHLGMEDQELLCLISVYSLYLTSIGDLDKALDPMQ